MGHQASVPADASHSSATTGPDTRVERNRATGRSRGRRRASVTSSPRTSHTSQMPTAERAANILFIAPEAGVHASMCLRNRSRPPRPRLWIGLGVAERERIEPFGGAPAVFQVSSVASIRSRERLRVCGLTGELQGTGARLRLRSAKVCPAPVPLQAEVRPAELLKAWSMTFFAHESER